MRLMRLTEPPQKKNKNNASVGQISMEALLLWAALAGILAVLTPAFAEAMNAYTLLAKTNQFTAFADELQQNIDWLSLAGEGSQVHVRVPKINEMKIEVMKNEIELTWDNEAFSHAKIRTISSMRTLEGTINEGETITLLREGEQITIR